MEKIFNCQLFGGNIKRQIKRYIKINPKLFKNDVKKQVGNDNLHIKIINLEI